MANKFITGFEWGTKYEITAWDAWNFAGIDASESRSGDYSMKLYGAYASISISLPGHITEYFIQFAYKTDGSFGSLGGTLFNWNGQLGDKRLGYLNFSDAGQARLYTSTYPDGTNEHSTLRATGLARLKINTWYVMEMRIKIDKDNGHLALKIDGVDDCEFSGPTTPYTGDAVDSIYWAHWQCWLDDIVINDTSGDFNNSWPGCLKVVLLRPNDDGTSEWMTSMEGHNYDMVNEVPYDPTEYVYTYSIGVRDSYGVQDLPEEAADILIVRGDAWAFKDSGSAAQNRKLVFSVQSGLTINDSPDQNLSLSYQLVKYPFDFNPDTNAMWTKEEVNNILAGIKSSS